MSFLKFFSGKKENIRTRFAPSPTGFLHIGGLRTALYSYIFSKQHGGKFILRIEDTDVNREVEGAVETIYRNLKWAGIKYDEGPDIGGPYGPYIQSQRLEIYKKYADKLVENNKAYHCFCSEETLKEMRSEQIAKKQIPKYDRRCLNLSNEEVQEKIKSGAIFTLRMKIPNNRVIEIEDIVRGKISFNTNELDDQIILKSDGYPTYHLAVVVDDHLMKISHVIRSEEWLPSTPKHILLYEYFDWEPPRWAHLSLILNPDKTKMSKRKGDVSVEYYIKKGYLPEAMINFLAFLGWNSGTEKEVYSIKELMKDFSLEKVHRSGAVFNIDKLDWLNSYNLRKISLDELTKKIIPFLESSNLIKNGNYNLEYIKKVVALEQPRLKKLSEVEERSAFFFKDPEYSSELLVWRDMLFKDVSSSLNVSLEALKKVSDGDFNCENLEAVLLKEAERARNKDKGRLLWPLRVALTGLEKSPGPFEVLEILGKAVSLKRIEAAIKKLS